MGFPVPETNFEKLGPMAHSFFSEQTPVIEQYDMVISLYAVTILQTKHCLLEFAVKSKRTLYN